MDHPETEVVTGEERSIHLNRITPIYPLTEGLPQRWLRALIWRTLARFEGEIAETWTDGKKPPPAPPLPRHSTLDTSFPLRSRALRLIHFPDEVENIELA